MPDKIHFSDVTYDGQFSRTLQSVYAGAADLGEAFVAADAVKHTTGGGWYDAWHALAERVAARRESLSEPVGRAQAALRASEYHRQSFFFLRHDIADPRLLDAFGTHVALFQEALTQLAGTSELLAIPYQSTTIKGYFFAPDASGAPRPTILFPAGYDSTAEEGWIYARSALERGFNVLSFEGPGQGASLYLDGLYFQPDWEAVLTPVVDAALARPDVDPAGLVLVGRSFAGYLAPRGAAFEHRLAALVCDPAQPDMAAHLPTGIVGEIAAPVSEAEIALSEAKREYFGSRMATHGISRVGDYFTELRRYDMLPVAAQISCPTLVIECEGDFAGGGGQTLADALTAPHRLVHLTAAEGAGGHCAGLGQRVWDGVVYDWLAGVLGR